MNGKRLQDMCITRYPLVGSFAWCVMLLCQFASAAVPVTQGLVLHLDAGAITGVSDGGTVNVWPDLSGTSRHATIGSGAVNLPVYKTGVLNGRPVVRFGSD